MKFKENSIISITALLLIFFLCGFSELHVTGDGMAKCLEGNGKRISEQIEVEPYKELSIDGAFTVVIDGKRPVGTITVSADGNVVKHIVITVKNEVLSITTDRSICTKTPVNIKIDGDNIHSVSATGATDIDFSAINNKRLKVHMSGAGSATLSGKTTYLLAELSGATQLQAEKLPAEVVEIKATGSSSAHVYAKEELDAYSSGASEIIFSGKPKDISKQELEVGEIVPFVE